MKRTGVGSGEILTFARLRPPVEDPDDDDDDGKSFRGSSRRVAYEVHQGDDEDKDEVCIFFFVFNTEEECSL